MIEAAAMHHPAAAIDAVRLVLLAAQAGIEPDEMKRGADPGDTQHHMGPAQDQADTIPDDGAHDEMAAMWRSKAASAASFSGAGRKDAANPLRAMASSSARVRPSASWMV